MIKNLSEGKCEACRIDAPLLLESEINKSFQMILKLLEKRLNAKIRS